MDCREEAGFSDHDADLTKSLPAIRDFWSEDYPSEEFYVGWKWLGHLLSSWPGAALRKEWP